MRTHLLKVMLAGAAIAVFAALGACGDDSGGDGDNPAVEERLDQIIVRLDGLQSRIEYHDQIMLRTQVLSGAVALDNGDLVGLAADALRASAIDDQWAPRTEVMLRAMQAVTWPEEEDIQPRAHAIEDMLFDALSSLLTDDLSTATSTLASAATAWGELRHDVFNHVAGPDADHGHSHD